MRRIFISFLIIALLPLFAFGQGMYAKLNVGYYFPVGTQTLLTEINQTATSNTSEPIDVSLGAGLDLGLAIGYMFSENIGAELGVSYLIGRKFEANENFNLGIFTRNSVTKLSGKSININPQVVITGGVKSLKPFAKFGLVFGFASINERDQVTDRDLYVSEWKYKGGVAIGFSADFGLEYSLSDQLSIAVSFRNVSMAYSPKVGNLEVATFNGVNELDNLETIDKEIEFVDKIDYTVNIEDFEPDQELREKYPFSGFGLNLGVKFNF